jgi:hypothetical protein
MSGQAPQSNEAGDKRSWGHHNHSEYWGNHPHIKKGSNVKNAATEIFTGIGFVVVAISILALVPSGVFWWWSFLIPAFALIGAGVGEYLRWKEDQRKQTLLESPENQAIDYQSFSQGPAISAPTTSELVKPSSVTEHTTRHLE